MARKIHEERGSFSFLSVPFSSFLHPFTSLLNPTVFSVEPIAMVSKPFSGNSHLHSEVPGGLHVSLAFLSGTSAWEHFFLKSSFPLSSTHSDCGEKAFQKRKDLQQALKVICLCTKLISSGNSFPRWTLSAHNALSWFSGCSSCSC